MWFKESLIKRQITLKKVIKAIMSLQESYFLSGDIFALKPMKLADVSELINMDVSTVSRVSNGKYIETSFGSFLMKELFFLKLIKKKMVKVFQISTLKCY